MMIRQAVPTSKGLSLIEKMIKKQQTKRKKMGKIKFTLIGRLASGSVFLRYSRPEIDIRINSTSVKLT